jgi:predicted PurR-regulated permease PerM
VDALRRTRHAQKKSTGMATESVRGSMKGSLVRFEPTPKGLLFVVLAVALAWIALQLVPVVLVVVVALFLVGTLNPAVEWLQKKGWRRGRAIALIFGLLLFALGGFLAVTLPALVAQVSSLVKQEPALRGRLADLLSESRLTESLGRSLRDIQYGSLARSGATVALGFSAHVAAVAAYLASAVFLGLYVMLDRDSMRGGLFALVPRRHHIRLSRVLIELESIVGGYIRGQAVTSLCMALFTGGLLTACGVDNALAIALFAGVADVLPYIGVVLSVAPAVLAALPNGPVIALIVLVALLVYEEFESRYLIPKVYGKVLRLPSAVVLLALLTGGTLMGITGALLALPAAAAVLMLIRELRVDLPGEDEDAGEQSRDQAAEAEYVRRVEGLPIDRAAAIAVEMSSDTPERDRAAPSPVTNGR